MGSLSKSPIPKSSSSIKTEMCENSIKKIKKFRELFMPRTNSCKDRDGKILMAPKAFISRWHEHFEELHNGTPEILDDGTELTEQKRLRHQLCKKCTIEWTVQENETSFRERVIFSNHKKHDKLDYSTPTTETSDFLMWIINFDSISSNEDSVIFFWRID
jgi:hypothetical protein